MIRTTDPGKVISCIWILCVVLGTAVLVRAERLPIKTYTTADGLARDQASRIVRDSQGLLWFCTVEGLSRFDGYKFTNYGIDQGLPNRQVNDFLETRGGVYWVATQGGLSRFNPGAASQPSREGNRSHDPRFILYRLGDDAGSQAITALYEDQAGTVWCGTGGGLYRLDQKNGQWLASFVELRRPGSPKLAVASIVVDRRGSVWISTWEALYCRRLDGMTERYATEAGLPAQNFTTSSLLEDREGRIWLGLNNGLYQIVSEPQPNRPVVARVYTTKDGLSGNSVSCLLQSSDGRLWVGTWDALSEFLPSAEQDGQRFMKYTSANGISEVVSLAEDGDGNLWIGTESHGVLKIVRSGFVTYNEADGLGGTRIGAISADRAGELCVFSGGAGKGFINRFDGQRFAAIELTLPKGIVNPTWGWYQNMFEDEQGEWWMSTGEGLVRYPKLSRLEQLTHAIPRAIYTTRNGLGGNEMFRLFEDSRGDVWIGTIDSGHNSLNRWERSTQTFHQYTKEDGLPEYSKEVVTAPTAFCEDAAGNLWIGFYHGGVARYRDGHFTFFASADGLPSGFIRALYLDHAGRLWIATAEGGVARLDNPATEHPQFIRYSTADGLSSNQATCITEDQWGRIYVGTGRGVDRLEPASAHIRHYTTADGLARNFVNVSFRDRNGALWFGGLDGLSRLIPEPDRPESSPPIRIGALRIGGVQQQLSELGEAEVSGLSLNANQNDLQIEFSGMSFAPGELLRYQHKLEGADRDWSALTDQRSINYANLAPGSYRFLVRAVTADGTFSQSPATVTFRILPPIWQRWWFLTVGVLVVVASTYTLYRYRVRQLIELERVRTRIATDLHDDIGASLSRMAILSEVVKRQDEVKSGTSRRMLTEIADSARGLVDAMSDIVWSIDPQRDDLRSVSARIRQFASDVLEARGIKWELKLPPELETVKLNAEQRRQLLLIFKEALNNVVRHAECVNVTLSLALEGRALAAEVRDDGRGFQLEGTDQFSGNGRGGNGLKNMRARVAQLGGEISIASLPGQGTCLTFKVPLK